MFEKERSDKMLSIDNILHGIYGFVKSIAKKAYRTCAILAVGATVLAVVSISSNSFGGSGKNNVTNRENQAGSEDEQEEASDADKKAEALLNEVSAGVQESAQCLLEAKDTVVVMVAGNNIPLTSPNVGETITDENGNVNIVNKIGLTITQEDYEALLRIVEAEAGNQDEIGRILVANVVFNRVRNEEFADSIYDVIFQNDGDVYQFQPIIDGNYYRVNVSEITKQCVIRALSGEDYSKGALYFTTSTSPYSWFNSELTFIFNHGAHYFYN